MPYRFENLNCLWSAVLVETLRRKGVQRAVICPGSRNAPLIFAFAENEGIEALSMLDERSAAFLAIGLAKSSGRPVALVCTSGSAVANFFPAVVEASEAGIPLVVLTADRPPELRDCAAGQTIDQQTFYGGYVRQFFDLATPENTLPMFRYLRQTLSYACERAVSPLSGPVHINAPFRDPLAPVSEEGFRPAFLEGDFESFFDGLEIAVSHRVNDALPPSSFDGERGVVLIGPNSPVDKKSWLENVSKFTNALKWPVLADAANPVRSNAKLFGCLVTQYEFILRSSKPENDLIPDRVVVIGAMPTCKSLREWLARIEVPVTILSPQSKNLDPTHSRTIYRLCDFQKEGIPLGKRNGSDYLRQWKILDSKASAMLDRIMRAENSLFEGKVSWLLSKHLPSDSSLCISNSMPPRDLEFYFSPSSQNLSVHSSRGANGIDGIFSTALGVAYKNQPCFLLTGDLALLHDSNGALFAKDFHGSLTILLLNNEGGGIFEMLPVSKFPNAFEKFFVTDQSIDFAKWSDLYGLEYKRIQKWEELSELLGQTSSPGIRVVEIPCDRKESTRIRKQWFERISGELNGL